ncbi:MAG: hypothetical protein M5R36_00845 [Deltaproteobacteria bacterium]|nr:hypothetical protein [Deltaproteobacteria bacterium]
MLTTLAHTYLDAGQPLAAARLFERASQSDPTAALKAAELYRNVGYLERALYMNAQIPDQKEKSASASAFFSSLNASIPPSLWSRGSAPGSPR